MKFTALLSVLLACFLVVSTSAATDEAALVKRVYNSVALLYSQTDDGTFKMRCTATAFEKTRKGYLFVSAAHCVGNDDKQHEKSASAVNIPFYLTFDETNVKHFYSATTKGVGYQHRGDDFAVFEVETKENWPIVELGDEGAEVAGDAFINVASPLGLGKQTFKGTISSLFLDRPIIQDDINWRGTMELQMSGTNGGSSGSTIVSVKQEKIVGFLVGVIGGSTIVAMPVSRFKKFQNGVNDNSYRWYAPDKE